MNCPSLQLYLLQLYGGSGIPAITPGRGQMPLGGQLHGISGPFEGRLKTSHGQYVWFLSESWTYCSEAVQSPWNAFGRRRDCARGARTCTVSGRGRQSAPWPWVGAWVSDVTAWRKRGKQFVATDCCPTSRTQKSLLEAGRDIARGFAHRSQRAEGRRTLKMAVL